MKNLNKILFVLLSAALLLTNFDSFSQKNKKEKDAPVLAIVELMPMFEGGETALYSYLGSHIVYPQIAKETGITGHVLISFIVEKDGSISNVSLLKGIGGGCDEEAIRVVKLMPKWKPGKQKGKRVRVQFNLPILFKLE